MSQAVKAAMLRAAVIGMATRYGEATQEYAYALNASSDERARHLRVVRRRFIALQRLTRTLADLAGGAR